MTAPVETKKIRRQPVLEGPTDEFLQKMTSETKTFHVQVKHELSRVKPGHPQYRKLKKAELRCSRILKNLAEMKEEQVSIF